MRLGQRVGFYLTDLQIQKVKKVSKKMGLTVSEIIRRALDEWLEKHKIRQKAAASDYNDLLDTMEKLGVTLGQCKEELEKAITKALK